MCDNPPCLLHLYATILVIGDNPTHYSSLVMVTGEVWDAKKSSKARRAIMPRLALSPVCRSKPIEVAIEFGHQRQRESYVDNR